MNSYPGDFMSRIQVQIMKVTDSTQHVINTIDSSIVSKLMLFFATTSPDDLPEDRTIWYPWRNTQSYYMMFHGFRRTNESWGKSIAIGINKHKAKNQIIRDERAAVVDKGRSKKALATLEHRRRQKKANGTTKLSNLKVRARTALGVKVLPDDVVAKLKIEANYNLGDPSCKRMARNINAVHKAKNERLAFKRIIDRNLQLSPQPPIGEKQDVAYGYKHGGKAYIDRVVPKLDNPSRYILVDELQFQFGFATRPSDDTVPEGPSLNDADLDQANDDASSDADSSSFSDEEDYSEEANSSDIAFIDDDSFDDE